MTLLAPRRITTTQYLFASIANALRLDLKPGHEGATADWHPLADLADDEGTGRHHAENIQPAPANHLLSPAAYQLVTGTTQQVTADVDQPTGLLDPAAVRALAREVTR